jgi:hypothetical protein
LVKATIVHGSKEKSFFHQLSPKRQGIGIVDRPDADRRAPGAGSSDQNSAVPNEMTMPALPPRMKKGRELIGHGIEASDIRALMFVIVQATPREVLQDGLAPMLLGNDVVHLKRKWIKLAWNAAIVTSIASMLANPDRAEPDSFVTRLRLAGRLP